MIVFICVYHQTDSPYHVNVARQTDPNKVSVIGPSLDSNVIRIGLPVNFTVDTTNAGEGTLKVNI